MNDRQAEFRARTQNTRWHRHVRITPEFYDTYMVVMSRAEIMAFTWLQLEAGFRHTVSVVEVSETAFEALAARGLIAMDVSEKDEHGNRSLVVGFLVRSYPDSPTINAGDAY